MRVFQYEYLTLQKRIKPRINYEYYVIILNNTFTHFNILYMLIFSFD